MSRYPAYAEYKASGVAWLGDIPAHWEMKRLKFNLKLQTQKQLINGQKVIALENIESKTGKFIETNSNYQGEDVGFDKGDILFGKLRPYLAKVYRAKESGIAFGDLLTYRPTNQFNGDFAYYSLIMDGFIAIVDGSTYGAKMPRASAEFIAEMPLSIPPIKEQTAIAAFLDKETAKMDTLIARQQRMIALLKEKRGALISHAVTKGLDPNAPMKPSGVEWLGDIPAHWEVRRLGVYGRFIAGSGFPDQYQGKAKGKYPFYKVSDTNLEGNDVYLSNANNYIDDEILLVLKANIAPEGGIFFPKVGAALLSNKRRLLTRPSITDNNTMVFIPISTVRKFWYYWLSILDFGKISNPGPVPSVNEAQLRDFPSISPPLSEQTAIAEYLDTQTRKIDTLITRAEQAIALLQERRSSLISAAVTGKIDVRDAI